jgi:succinate dehydrogenase flavoprotein subunit
MMQREVGIVRRQEEMEQALVGLGKLKERASRAGVQGNREYNPGWHTALDLDNLLTVSEAITRAALERQESRGGHFRDDFPEKDPGFGRFNIVIRKGDDGEMRLDREPIPPMPTELSRVIAEQR